MVQDILNLKRQLLNPKRSDRFEVWMQITYGWKLFSIVVGNKTAKVRAVHGHEKHSMSIRQLKEELTKIYWYAARQDASRLAREEGRKKRKRNWERDYA